MVELSTIFFYDLSFTPCEINHSNALMTIFLSLCIYGKWHLAFAFVLCVCEFSLDNEMSEYEMHLANKAATVMENLTVN